MDSPLNRMIDRSSNRKAASSMKAKAKRTKALNDQVLSLVHEANATALPERHVTPRAALIVMARAMKELSSLPEESRNHGVLREVSKFISLNQKTLLASASIKHVDLLPKGHPLSPLNASLTEDDLRKKYAEWIAADPAIADEARPLVAMAHSLPPESIEREHAFLRLRTLQASAVPAYFKIDDVTAITAAFSNGNSSAARRARVALQWRDRFGRWIEMGRGVNFRFRMPDGSIATGKGNYVGAGSNPRVERTSSGTSLISDSGLIEVSGVPGLAPGLYAIDSKNAAAYQARIPGFEAPQAPSFDDQFDADIPSIEDLKAARRDLPIGWKKQGPYFVSDDNYAVIPGPNGQPQAVTRLNADGRPAGTVGNARNWSEVNDLIEKDQPSFDKEIARIEAEGEEGKLPLARIPGATEEDVVSFDDIANMQKQRAEENKRFDESRPAAKPLGDKDLNGNVVPKDWTRDPNDDTSYTRQMPLRDGGSYPLVARVTEDGKYIAGHASGWIPAPGTDGRGPSRKFESWREIESSIPEFVDYLNEGFTKDNPIVADKKERRPLGGTDDYLGPNKTKKANDAFRKTQGMTLDFADPEQAAEDAGLPEDTPFNEIVKAWFDQNIKPVAPTARLEKSEEGGITPSVSITADNEKDLLNAFRVYFGDDEATMQDLRDHSTIFDTDSDTPERTPEELKKIEQDLRKNMEKNSPPREFPQEPRDDRYDARIFTEDLVEIDKSTLDALNKRMREDSTGEYNMEGVTFAPDNNGNIVMYPDAWEPGDKIIGRIENDGIIDWESDEQYDKYADAVREALRGMGGSSNDRVVIGESAATEKPTRSPASELRPGDKVKHNGEWKTIKSIDKLNLGSRLNFEDGTSSDIGIKSVDVIRKPDATGGALVDNRDGTFRYKGVTLKKVFGKWTSGKALDPRIGKHDTIEDAMAKIDSLESSKAEKPSAPSGNWGDGPAEPPSGLENSVSKEVFNGLKNKIAEENKGGYSKSGLYFFHDLIGPDDGALSKDITFMIDEDEEFSPLGTISSDGTITWNDPSKQEDWAPALESALKSFAEGKDKFTKNKNTGYMEYDLGDGYVVSYGKDEDGNWSAEMNRFSRDGGLDSENSFPAKSEADARAMAEGLIDRYNDSQEWEGGDGDGGGFDLGDYENSPEFIKQANEITKDWPTMDYATYINDKDPEFEEHKYMPLPEGSKLVATGLNGEDGNQLLVKLPDGNYILANDVLDNEDYPAFEQIYPASVGGPGDLYGDDNLSWEDATLDRLTNYDPYSGFVPLNRYGYFERFGIPKHDDRDDGKFTPPSGDGEGTPAEGTDNLKQVDEALAFLDKHMDDKGLSQAEARGIFTVQDDIKKAKKFLEEGNIKEAISYFRAAYDVIVGNDEAGDGYFPRGTNANKAENILDELLTSLEAEGPGSGEGGGRGGDGGDGGAGEGGEDEEYTLDFALDQEDYGDIGLDPEKDYSDAQVAEAWIKTKGLEGKVKFVSSGNPSGQWPEFTFTISKDSKDAFAEAYGYDSWEDLDDDFELDTRKEVSIRVPKDSVTVARDRDDVAVIVRMPDGSWVEYDNEENVSPISDEEREELIKDFKGEENIRWRDENGEMFFEEALKGEDEGPDDEPPSPGGGTPPKVPSPSTPGSPALIKDFDAPAGAYQLRTTEYEPEGRVDETSTDFTDDPRRLATKFSLDELVTALTQALIGRPSDDAMQDILDANVGDDDDLPDLDDLGDVANSPAPRAGEVTGTGAGALEFNAGEEYVLAEALYNAVYEAGGDPNRVIANAYDAVNGNRNNARKLLEAQGGVPSQEESQLIEDMTDEIRQIKDATPEDDEISASQKRDKPEKTFKGELIENVPVDFNNPDYYDMDTDAYIPSVPEIDENGYTDNPEILALDYFEADLIEQMIEGITDGSGVALLDFGGEDGVHEVPVEALRDALQLKAYNTNKILFDLRDESNDMSEPKATPLAPTPAQAPVSQVEFAPFSDALANLDEEDPSISPETVLMLDDAANALVDMFGNGIPADARLVAYNSANGMLVIHTPGTDLQEEAVISIHPNGGAVRLQSNIDWFLDAGGIYGWKPMPDEVDQAIRQENAKRFPQEAAPSSETTPASEAPASPFVYPGPREAGYSVNNTTLASDGSIVGAGSIVIANRDGKRGIVVSIQNDPEYVRIKFDDGKVAVRSANQIKAVSNPDGTLATAPEGALAPSAPSPATDVTERLDAPLRDAPNIARSGSVWGINDSSSVPARIAPFTQKDVPQSKFKAWRSRDAEIAKAANTRASFDSLFKAAQAALIAKEERSLDYPALMEEFEALLKDAYGARDGLTFGADEYRVAARDTRLTYASGDIKDGNVTYTMQIRFEVLGKNGNVIGEGSRYITSVVTKNSDGSLSHDSYVKNEILKIYDRNNQKTGFATAYNRHMENWYIANGVEKVKVLAYGGGREWKGGFVWALNGFNWESPSSALSVARAIERAARTPQEKELATRLRERVSMANGDISQIPLPIEMALIGWYNGADNWLGKEVMTDVSWDGVKHLDPGAKEQMYSANYDQIKSAERRVRAGQNKANVSSMGLVQIMDNQFQDGNPDLMPYMEQIRDALRNNRPLGFLSPAAKAALNSYVSNQLLDKDSKMPMDDLFRLRNALDAEYRADYGFADPFAGVGDSLVNFSLDDFFDNSDALKAAGFASFPLGQYESGQNTTFRVIHKESGQVFFVKEESLSQEYNGERGVVNEIEANVILNALGIHGLPSVRASRENQDVFIMSQAGAILPLVDAPINADKMHYTGIVDANGQTSDYLRGTYLDVMANPEDILSMAIIDMLGDSEDRHDGNWMVAFDSTSGKMRIFPIDHGLNRIDTEDSSVRSFLLSNWPSAGEVYQRVMPRLIDKAGEARTKEMFLNQVEKLIKNLDNPLYEPKGEELAALISKWGSYEAFKDAMKERLTPILTPGTRENDGINKATKKTYWR